MRSSSACSSADRPVSPVRRFLGAGASSRVAMGSTNHYAKRLICSVAQNTCYHGLTRGITSDTHYVLKRLPSTVCNMPGAPTPQRAAHLWHHVTMMMRPPGAHTRASSPTNRSLSGLAQRRKTDCWSHNVQRTWVSLFIARQACQACPQTGLLACTTCQQGSANAAGGAASLIPGEAYGLGTGCSCA